MSDAVLVRSIVEPLSVDFHGERRQNATRQSTTDPDARKNSGRTANGRGSGGAHLAAIPGGGGTSHVSERGPCACEGALPSEVGSCRPLSSAYSLQSAR